MLALGRMGSAQPKVVELHLDGRPEVPRAEQQGAPLPGPDQESDIDEPGDHERPREREMPVEPARQPAAEPRPLRERLAVKRVGVRLSPRAEMAEGQVDLQAARDHPQQHDRVEPMGQAHQAVVSLDRGSTVHPTLPKVKSKCSRNRTPRASGRFHTGVDRGAPRG